MYILDLRARERFFADDADHRVSENRLYIRLCSKQLTEPHLAGKLVEVLHHGDFLRRLGKQQRLLQCRVAAADYNHMPVLVERAVTHRAKRHAVAEELVLAGYAEQPMARAGGQNDRPRREDLPAAAHMKVAAAALDARDLLDLDVRALLEHLPDHLVGKLTAADRQKRGVVLDLRREGHLPAEAAFLDDEHALAGAARIQSGGQPRRAAADDDDVMHGLLLPSARGSPSRPQRPQTSRPRRPAWAPV